MNCQQYETLEDNDYYNCYIIKLSCLPFACYHFSATVITPDILVYRTGPT